MDGDGKDSKQEVSMRLIIRRLKNGHSVIGYLRRDCNLLDLPGEE